MRSRANGRGGSARFTTVSPNSLFNRPFNRPDRSKRRIGKFFAPRYKFAGKGGAPSRHRGKTKGSFDDVIYTRDRGKRSETRFQSIYSG